MKTMYKTGSRSYGRVFIEPVDILKDDGEYVLPFATDPGAESYDLKRGMFQNYFDTWIEAHTFLIEGMNSKLDLINKELMTAMDRRNEIEQLTNEGE